MKSFAAIASAKRAHLLFHSGHVPAMWSYTLLWMQTLSSTEPCEAGALELSDVSVMGLLADMAHGAWMGAEHTARSQLHGSFQVRMTAKPVPSAL